MSELSGFKFSDMQIAAKTTQTCDLYVVIKSFLRIYHDIVI